MKEVFKDVKKLLCYLIISLFIMGIGGERVSALVINRNGNPAYAAGNNYNTTTGLMDFVNGLKNNGTKGGGNGFFMFITADGRDAYCMDSDLKAPQNGTDLSIVDSRFSEDEKIKIGTIINNSNRYSSSDDSFSSPAEKFYTTQAIIWEKFDEINKRNSPYNGGLETWVETHHSNFHDTILEIDDNTYSTIVEKYNNESIQIVGNNSNLLTKNESTNLMESSELYIDYTKLTDEHTPNQFAVSVQGGSIVYNGQTYENTTVNIGKDDSFKVVTAIPNENETVSVRVSVNYTYDFTLPYAEVYAYIDATNLDIQRMAVYSPKNYSNTVSDSKQFEGINTVTPPQEITVSFQKKDLVTGNYIAGAKLEIRDSEGNRIQNLTSVASEDGVTYTFYREGDYCLIETKAPKGYAFETDENKRKTCFKIEKQGSEFVLTKEGQVVSPAKVLLQNSPSMLRIRKVDQNGEPVAGIKVFLQEATIYGAHSTNPLESQNASSFYGITDSNGYVKKCIDINCTSYDTTSNGIYTFGNEIPVAQNGGGNYTVYELADTKKYDFETFNLSGFNIQYRFGGSVHNTREYSGNVQPNSTWGFSKSSKGNITILNNYITKTEKTEGNISYTELELKNYTSISIGKTDITSGKEIGGATLVVYDPEIVNATNEDNIRNIIDTWVSEEGKTHKVRGIVPGHKYTLEETIAPVGYYKMATAIDFVMDENGNVTVYENGTDNEINDLKGSNYELLITNDKAKTLTVSKTSFVTGEEVAGAELKICTESAYNEKQNNCDATWSWVSGDDGLDQNGNVKPHVITGMGAGKYYLIETTAPIGYVRKTKAVEFEFQEGQENDKIEFTNNPTKATIKKLDLVTKQRIAGATLQILNAEDRSIAKDASGNELTWVSTEDSDWEIYAIPAGKYILVEKQVPEGYQEGMIIDGITTTEYEFEISDQEGDVNIEFGKEVLNAPNTGISTLNLFAVGGLLVFAGYETIKIYRRKTING